MQQTNQGEFKTRAKRLRSGIRDILGMDCKSAQSLELIARLENYPNWDALCGSISVPAHVAIEVSGNQAEVPLTLRQQLAQILSLEYGFRNAIRLEVLIASLVDQDNVVISSGWAKLLKELPDMKNLGQMLKFTGLFSEEVIAIARVASASGDWAGAARTVVEYLRVPGGI